MNTALVFTGGPSAGAGPPALALDGLQPDIVIAVDSGLHLADRFEVRPHVVIGDMDSVDPVRLDRAQRDGVDVDRHPMSKDQTDLELGLDRAVESGAERVVVLGGSGGRLDHLIGEVLLLGSPRFAEIDIEAYLGPAQLRPVWGHRTFLGTTGATLSIFPVNGPATVHTDGLAWPLRSEVLEPGTTRGVSNQFASSTASVRVDDGCVVVVIPGEEQQ